MTTQGFFGMLGKVLSLLEFSLGNLRLGQLFISCAEVHHPVTLLRTCLKMESNISDLITEIPWGLPQPRQTALGSLLRKFKFTSSGQHGEALHSHLTCQCLLLMLPLSKQQQKSILLLLIYSFGIRLFSGCILSFSLW